MSRCPVLQHMPSDCSHCLLVFLIGAAAVAAVVLVIQAILAVRSRWREKQRMLAFKEAADAAGVPAKPGDGAGSLQPLAAGASEANRSGAAVVLASAPALEARPGNVVLVAAANDQLELQPLPAAQP